MLIGGNVRSSSRCQAKAEVHGFFSFVLVVIILNLVIKQQKNCSVVFNLDLNKVNTEPIYPCK